MGTSSLVLILIHHSCARVWRWLSRMRAASDEVCPLGMLGVVNGIADLTGDVSEVT
jgi:hypothetical protein